MKRIFTDADIYEDEWYQNLPTEYKLLWDYICRRAEYAIWKPNWGLVEFQLRIKIDPKLALKAFNSEGQNKKERVMMLKNGRWFIPSWISFQYPGLSQSCPAHRPVFKFYEVNYPYLLDRYLIPIQYRQEKEIEKEMEKEIEKGGVGGKNGFSGFWEVYPRKRSKGQAEKAWASLNPDEQLQDRIKNALERATKSEDWRKDQGKFIPYPATWLRAKGWEDVIATPQAQSAEMEKYFASANA